jgi:hypothetical protein
MAKAEMHFGLKPIPIIYSCLRPKGRSNSKGRSNTKKQPISKV